MIKTLDDVLAHPIRIKLINTIYNEGPISPVQIAPMIDENLGTTAFHVRVLLEAGLIVEESTRQRRGATEHFYALDLLGGAWSDLAECAWMRLRDLSMVHAYAQKLAEL